MKCEIDYAIKATLREYAMNFDAIFKICLFGDAGCGKTTLTKRYMTNQFISDTIMTIGVNLETKTFCLGERRIKLQIWDFGGEERFRFFLPGYIKGTHGGILMYDITNLGSLSHLDEWLLVIKDSYQSFPIVLTGGKQDLENERQVSHDEGQKFANTRQLGAFIETSSKTGYNVEKLFVILTNLMFDRYKNSWAKF